MPNIVEGSASISANVDVHENVQRIRNNSSKVTAKAGINEDDEKEKIVIYVRR